MKIIYIDFNEKEYSEDYSMSPTSYGGGRAVAASFLDKVEDFHLYSDAKSLQNIKNKKSNTHTISYEDKNRIKGGEPLEQVIPESRDADIILQHFANIHINTSNLKAKYFVWPIGWGEAVHPLNTNVCLFDKEVQNPQFKGNHKIYDVVLGIPLPPFQEYEKENFVFNCCRITRLFRSIELATFCIKCKIPIVFAGPIDENYKEEFWKYVDGNLVKYMGVISEEEKGTMNKKSRAHVMLQSYPISVTLSAKQALSYGTPILASRIGGWPAFIKNGYNGFVINNWEELLFSWQNCINRKLKQKNCYNSVRVYSEERMIDSFMKVFKLAPKE